MLRLFVACPVPPFIADRATAIQAGVPGARWSPRENLHVTLRFCGDVDEAQAEDLDAALAGISQGPIRLELKGAGWFGGDRPHALHLHVDGGEPLRVLRGRVEKACRAAGLVADTGAYTPHLTLAYLREGADLDRVMAFVRNQSLFRADPWTADRFHLYSSHPGRGPSRYRIEAEYPLLG
jgi:2'-5' RNA ligase